MIFMKCNRCGSEFEGNFCNKCGAPAQSENPYESRNNPVPPYGYQRNIPPYGSPASYQIRGPKKTNKLLAGIIIGLAALFIIGAIVAPITIGVFSAKKSCAGTDKGVFNSDEKVTFKHFTYSIQDVEFTKARSDNPAKDGKNLLIISFAAKNIDDSERSLSLEFKCYSGPYQLNDINDSEYAYDSVSAGKTVLLTLSYELPDDAEEIELECSIGNPLTGNKFTYKIR